MGIGPHPYGTSQPQERRASGRHGTADPAEQSKTMTAPRRRSRLPGQPRQLDAGPLEPQIGSFALHLAAEGKAARTVQGYTLAVRWFAAGYLAGQPGKTSWEQVDAQDIQRWMTQLLHQYSSAYASSGRCGSSSNGGPTRTNSPTRWPTSGHPRWQCEMSRSSAA